MNGLVSSHQESTPMKRISSQQDPDDMVRVGRRREKVVGCAGKAGRKRLLVVRVVRRRGKVVGCVGREGGEI
uniref:Uncharacterized protein n=1 Tax=Picea sitchensis TaxID=3332 RepID=A0A6B9XUN5_PICSI|nr:hypothetical protein Q903MT_gene3844 [Picea sitchensis]